MMPQDIPATCNGCDKKFSIEHALPYPKGGLFLARNNDAANEWGDLGDRSLVPSDITYEPKINSRTVQGERTGAGVRHNGGASDGGADTEGEAQGGRERTVNAAARLSRSTGKVEVTAESRSDISAHCFWKRGTTTMFNIRIVNLDAGSYLCMTTEKDLSKAEK